MALVLMATHGWGTLFVDPADLEAGVGLQSSFTNPADATAVTHYADDAGASPSTGPVTADANGRLMRWVEEGTYDQALPGGTVLEVQAVSGGTLASVERKVVDVYLATHLPGGFVSASTDCTAAIQEWSAEAQDAIDAGSGVRMVYGADVYNFDAIVDGELVRLEGATGVIIEGAGTFADQHAYGAAADDRAWLFRLYNCHSINARLRATSEQQVYGGTELPNGLVTIACYEGCTDMDINVNMVGGREGVSMMRLFGDPLTDKSRGGRIVVHTEGTFYAYSGQFSGDDMDVTIDADAPGRAFTIYGVSNNRIKARCKNQILNSPISMYGGAGCSNIDIKWYDHESTNASTDGITMKFRVGPSGQLGTHRKIKIDFDVSNPGDNTFYIAKTVSDSDGTNDTTGRGHVLDGLEITGNIEINNTDFRDVIGHGSQGELVAPDIMRGIHFHDMIIKGSQARVLFRATCLQDVALVDNVTSDYDFLVENLGNSKVSYRASQATRFSKDALDIHSWHGCNATGTNALGLTTKTFVGSTGTGIGGLKPPTATHAQAGAESLYISSEKPNKLAYRDNNNGRQFLKPEVYSGTLNADTALSNSDPLGQVTITGAMTANRTMTLSATAAVEGDMKRITHKATGGFTWDVGGLKTISVNQWCDVMFNGTAWELTAFGSL